MFRKHKVPRELLQSFTVSLESLRSALLPDEEDAGVTGLQMIAQRIRGSLADAVDTSLLAFESREQEQSVHVMLVALPVGGPGMTVSGESIIRIEVVDEAQAFVITFHFVEGSRLSQERLALLENLRHDIERINRRWRRRVAAASTGAEGTGATSV